MNEQHWRSSVIFWAESLTYWTRKRDVARAENAMREILAASAQLAGIGVTA